MYQILSQLPVPKSGQFVASDAVQVTTTVRDNATNARRSISLQGSLDQVLSSGEDMGDIVASKYAPVDSICYPRRAILRETTSKKRHLEIWIGNTLEVSKDLTETHSSVYTEGQCVILTTRPEFFSGFVFAASAYAFMYVAEEPEPEDPAAKYRFIPTLGETFQGKKRPAIFLFRWDPLDLDVPSSLIRISPSLPDNHVVLFGQPVFSPIENNIIYATGYEYASDGRLLGLKWCYNRPSGIWRISIPETDDSSPVGSGLCQKITSANLSCRSPRVYRDANTSQSILFWLSHASGGPHAGTFSLHSADIGSGSSARTVVDTVWEPRTSDGFPGLYPETGNLPASPFLILNDKLHLAISSTWRSRSTVLLVSTDDGAVSDLTPDAEGRLYSWSVLATDSGSQLLCSRSAPSIPHEIVLGRIDEAGNVTWKVLSSPYMSPAVKSALSQLSSSVVAIPNRGKTETIVVHPSDATPANPCVQFIHGGPHGVSTTAFSPEIAAYALWGYTMSLPNYTGSVGFGEASVRALIGNCGTLDVQDCMATVGHLVDLGVSSEGGGKQFVIGGSHGGFLAAHRKSCFLKIFRSSTEPSCIYFNEWGVQYPIFSSPMGFPNDSEVDDEVVLTHPPRRTPEESLRLFKTAPIAYVNDVRAHVLLHIGGSDVRVTPTHGIDYYHALKGRRPGQDADLLLFEGEGHSLDGVEASRLVWESTVHWFDKYRAM
ncbi:Alpha/Beta hydrolase protein [Mycena amicta]|nr:Alpha/Beta hydrolase protein [Mycena amicta]